MEAVDHIQNKVREYVEVSPNPNNHPVIDAVVPTILETSVLGLAIFYIINVIVRPLLVDDRARWFQVLEKLADSIDRLADKFDDLDSRIARLEDKLK